MKKNLIVLLVAMLATQTAYADFYDIPEGIEKERIEYLEKKGVINGVGEGRFAPERNVTRAEFTAMVNRAMGYEEKDTENKFSDISGGDWYYNDVLVASKTGIIAGFPDGTFKPDENITHEQAVKILVSVYETKYSVTPSGDMATLFEDYYDISDWARGYVSKGTMLSIAKGFAPETDFGEQSYIIGSTGNADPDADKSITKFKPQGYTSRLEAGDMVYSLLNALEMSQKADVRN